MKRVGLLLLSLLVVVCFVDVTYIYILQYIPFRVRFVDGGLENGRYTPAAQQVREGV